MLLPSVDDVFARSEDGSTSPVGPLSPPMLFNKSPKTSPTHGAAATGHHSKTPRAASIRQQDIPVVLRTLYEMSVFSSAKEKGGDGADKPPDNLLHDPNNSAVVFDIDALRAAFAEVREAFPAHWIHCMAIKCCPLAFVIQELLDAGLGVEAASLVELYMALAHGCSPSLAVFDSPAKTDQELEMALYSGTLVNANSLDELDRIAVILQRHSSAPGDGGVEGRGSDEVTTKTAGALRVGIRLNPLVGAGSLSALSTSVPNSKFGVAVTPGNVRLVIDAFRRWPWMVALHTHVGSQGCELDKLGDGIATLCHVADQVDDALGKGRVALVDIGGGLSANYESDEVTPTFREYAAVLRRKAPKLFSNTKRIVITEFGRSLVAKAAITVSTVEYVRANVDLATNQTSVLSTTPSSPDVNLFDVVGEKSTSDVDTDKSDIGTPTTTDKEEHEEQRVSSAAQVGHQTLVTHMGADLFLRSSYCPGHYGHRLSMYSRRGDSLPGPSIKTEIAGPLCFEGDYLARGSRLPRAAAGDLVVAHDTGANTISLFSRHCSRRAPAVYGYSLGKDGKLDVKLIKKKESVRDVARFWGAR